MLTGAGTQFLPLQSEEAEDNSNGDKGQVNVYHAPDSRETAHSDFFVFLKCMMGRRTGLRESKSLAPSHIKQGLYDTRVHPDDQALHRPVASGTKDSCVSTPRQPCTTVQWSPG